MKTGMRNYNEQLVNGKEYIGIKRKRNNHYVYEKIFPELLERKEKEGWELYKELKNTIKIKKRKPIDLLFEDEVWVAFASMGFHTMNRDRNLVFRYDSKNSAMTKQIDVLAIDDETVVFIECKAAESLKQAEFKTEIEAYGGVVKGLRDEARKSFPGKKIAFIFATCNYQLSSMDIKRLEGFGIKYFNEKTINYYRELSKHLGGAARYQLLGNLFANKKIDELDNKVPAIKGKMGGETYYSFNIEPEKLLKFGYILHRNEANTSLMPTYQRLIKKSRLTRIQDFVNNGGFFPNSIIINIDGGVEFSQASLQVKNSESKIGILSLPKKYRSAYIIDGQHRLYGYADTKYGNKNTIPVVAFSNLSKNAQVKLFMEINENQKSVPKNLQNTLNANILWESKFEGERRKAIGLTIAQELGLHQDSALYDRVIIGENDSSSTRCITIESISIAISKSNFLNRYAKNNTVTDDGIIDLGNNKATKEKLLDLLIKVFNYIAENSDDEWNKGDDECGLFAVNVGIYGLIRIISDIAEHLGNVQGLSIKKAKTKDVLDEMIYYIDPVIDFVEEIDDEERIQLKKTYGGGGKIKIWRTFQSAVHNVREDFNPEGLDKWRKDNTKMFNTRTFSMINEIEPLVRNHVIKKLKDTYRGAWIKEIPKKNYQNATNKAGNINYEKNTLEEQIEVWECLDLNDCRDIILYGKHWSDLFEDTYTCEADKGKRTGTKAQKTEWMVKITAIKNKQNSVGYSVTEEDFELVNGIYEWMGNVLA